MIDKLIEEYQTAKVRIAVGKKRVAELTPRERAGMLLQIESRDVAAAFVYGRRLMDQITQIPGHDIVQVLKWEEALKLLEKIKG